MRGRNGANALSHVKERFAMARHPQRDNEQYTDEEAQRRFLAAVKAGLNTKPKPLKSITPKGVPASSKIGRHLLKRYCFPFLEAVCTYWMRRFAALSLWLQEPSDSVPEFLLFIPICLSIPFFKVSHLFFKLAYSIQQCYLRLSCSEQFFLKFYDRPVASGDVADILKSLYNIKRGLDGAQAAEDFPHHCSRS